MKGAWILARKDFRSYFHSWTGVLLAVFFLVIAGLFFCLLVLNYARFSFEASKYPQEVIQSLGLTRFVYTSFFLNMAMILIFLVPLISMRAFSEEKKQQTLELLYTYPFSDFDIVWGKFWGMLQFFSFLLLPTAVYLGWIYFLGGRLDGGQVALGYVGFILLAASYLSLGLFVSALSENQVVSAVVTFGVLIVFWILDWVAGFADGLWAHFFSALSPLAHYRDFTLGILDFSHTVYFVFFQLYFLFLALRVIEARHWKTS
ncbi:MAG: ABC transporter permease subunit [Candidatus Omnitrophica bacterium]|nr:ABC transporter permease subunit [Candidatus Omnitrophota bacterium]